MATIGLEADLPLAAGQEAIVDLAAMDADRSLATKSEH